MDKRSCLFLGCEKEGKTRGLCSAHYAVALVLVRKKETTWTDLEKKNKSLPAHPPRHNATKVWFLE